MKRVASWLAIALVGSGVLLTGLNLAGLSYLPDRHPDTIGTNREKAGISLREPQLVFEELAVLGNVENEQDVAEITRIFSSGVMHYWPEVGERDKSIFYDWRENWVLALGARLESLLIDFGLLNTVKFGRLLERFDYHNIIAKGVGFCSQVSLAVTDYMQEINVPSYVWGLDGHVVAVVGPLADGKEYIVDSDYGVFLPHSRAEIEASPDLVREAYYNAGYKANLIKRLVAIYGPEGNGRYSLGDWELPFFLAKWLFPVVMIIFGVIIGVCLTVVKRRQYLKYEN